MVARFPFLKLVVIAALFVVITAFAVFGMYTASAEENVTIRDLTGSADSASGRPGTNLFVGDTFFMGFQSQVVEPGVLGYSIPDFMSGFALSNTIQNGNDNITLLVDNIPYTSYGDYYFLSFSFYLPDLVEDDLDSIPHRGPEYNLISIDFRHKGTPSSSLNETAIRVVGIRDFSSSSTDAVSFSSYRVIYTFNYGSRLQAQFSFEGGNFYRPYMIFYIPSTWIGDEEALSLSFSVYGGMSTTSSGSTVNIRSNYGFSSLNVPSIYSQFALLSDMIRSDILDQFDRWYNVSDDYDRGYSDGLYDGRVESNDYEYDRGYDAGYNAGVLVGEGDIESSITGFLPSILGATGDFLRNALDFEVFGVSMLTIFGTFGAIFLVAMVIKMVM